jgi:hypothetical protein
MTMIPSRAHVLTIGLVAAVLAGCQAVDTTSPEESQGALTSSAAATLQINCGGPAVSPFQADVDFVGGATLKTNARIDTSRVSNPAPVAVYQTARVGTFAYKLVGLAPSSSHQLRLHFAEIKVNGPRQRRFDVSINGVAVLTNFDVFATAGGRDIAVVETFSATASASGEIDLGLSSARDKALISAVEVLSAAPLGTACTAGTQCASGNCVDGVCCGSASCGSCSACNLAGSAGTCRVVPVGTPDPRGVCVDQGAATCGTDGRCDGTGACQLYAAGTVCSAASCPVGAATLTKQGTCSGAGTCVASLVSCSPFVCEPGNVCGVTCVSDVDCAAGFHCDVATNLCQ